MTTSVSGLWRAELPIEGSELEHFASPAWNERNQSLEHVFSISG
jgi:hypothetical protein